MHPKLSCICQYLITKLTKLAAFSPKTMGKVKQYSSET